MRIDLTRARSRSLFLVMLYFLAGIFAFLAAKVWFAAQCGDSARPDLWLKAAKVESDNAAYWERLGLYEQWNLVSGDPRKAAAYLERATAVNPGLDQLWMELAGAYETLGDVVRAGQSYEKAQQAHPISSDVAWRYGSFLLRQGDVRSGFAEIRRALTGNPALTPSAIVECWKANPDVDVILSTALPARLDCYLAAINFFVGEKQFDAALAVWKRLVNLKQLIEMAQAIPLTNALIDHNRLAEAQQTWQQALDVTTWPIEKNNNGSIVFNGGFEHQPADGGFDWREQNIPGVSYAVDTAVVHSGRQSMRVAFDGSSNFDLMNLLQYVPVKPDKAYHFSAYVRTDAITTDSGLRFLIYDPFHPDKVQSLTPNMIGTTPWTPVNSDIVAGSDTDLLVIALRRFPSWKFDNKLSGTAWVDDVALIPVENVPKAGVQ